MAGRYGDVDYPTLTKRSFLFGIGLFALGVASEERRVASAGAVLWVAILAATLLGMV